MIIYPRFLHLHHWFILCALNTTRHLGSTMIWLCVATWNYFPTVLPCWSLVMLPSPLTQREKVRQWLWIKAPRSNELITGGSAFSTELKSLCYYVSYADKRHIRRASREVHLTQFLSTIICWGLLALQIGAGGLWSGLWPIAADLWACKQEKERRMPIIWLSTSSY